MPTDGFNLSQIEEMINETEFGQEFYEQSLMSNDTYQVSERFDDVLENAKMDEYKLPEMDATATIQDSDCGQNSVDVASFKQASLKMVGFKIEGQFCPQKLEPYFLAKGLPRGQNYTDFNPLQAQVISRVQKQIAKKMAILPWYGATGADTVTYNEPWMDLIRDGIAPVGTATPTSGGTTGGDAAGAYNIVDALIQVFIDNADAAGLVYEESELVIKASPKFMDLYWKNYRKLFGENIVTPELVRLAEASAQTLGFVHPGTRVSVVKQNALGLTHDVVITRRENQVLAFDLMGDTTRTDLWYDKTDDLIYWRLKAKMGTAIHSFTSAPPNIAYWGAAS